MQQNIQTCWTSEDSLADTQWGKDASLFRLQQRTTNVYNAQNIQSTRTSEDAFADTQWGKDALHCDYSPIQVRDLKAYNTRLHSVGTS